MTRPAAPLLLALFEPDIAQNTGAMMRTCACLGVEAAIIEPAGFRIDDSRFRRAAMDYIDALTSSATIRGPNSRHGAPQAGAGSCS